jgi:hypothetical protein
MDYKILVEEYSFQKQNHTIISGLMNEINRETVAFETVEKMREEDISMVTWDIRETKLEYYLMKAIRIADLAKFELMNTDHVAVIYRNDAEQYKHASNVDFNRSINIYYFKDDLEAARKGY